MKFIWSYMRKHIWAIILVLFMKSFSTVLELFLPYILEYMIDTVAPTKDVRLILLWGVIMLTLAILVRFISVGVNRGSVRIARKCIYKSKEV